MLGVNHSLYALQMTPCSYHRACKSISSFKMAGGVHAHRKRQAFQRPFPGTGKATSRVRAPFFDI